MIDLRLYYWATQLTVINDWMNGGWSDSTYIRELQPMGLKGMLGMMYGDPVTRSIPEVTQAVITAWRGALRWIRWDKRISAMTPLWAGSWLSHSAGLKGFGRWDLIGISLLGDVTENGLMKDFTTLQAEYSLDRTQFYKYLQLRHALAPYRHRMEDLAEFNPLEAKLLNGTLGKGGISRLYKHSSSTPRIVFQLFRKNRKICWGNWRRRTGGTHVWLPWK